MYKLFAMDVDGTLTDGSVLMDGSGSEYKRFNIQDGMGIARFRAAGGKVAFISGRYSAATELRARELHVDFLANGIGEKLPKLIQIADQLGIKPSEVAYIGDDVNDLDCARWVGLGIAVANAVPELKEAADLVTTREGGNGAVREVADLLLSSNRKETE